MYRFSTLPVVGEPPLAVSFEVLEAVSVLDLPAPQALNRKAHPSARIAVRRTLNVKRIPFCCDHAPPPGKGTSYIAAEASTTEANPLNIQQQVLTLPGTDDLREGFVFRLLDGGIGQNETVAEQIDQCLGLAQQA